MDSKLKCVFMLPDQDLNNQENNAANGGSTGGGMQMMSNKSEFQSKQAIPPSPKVRRRLERCRQTDETILSL